MKEKKISFFADLQETKAESRPTFGILPLKTFKKPSLMLILLLACTIKISSQEIFDAVRKGDYAKIKELVEKNPNLVNAKNSYQSTPLHVAGESDNEVIAEYLIDKGADLTAMNGSMHTPLMVSGLSVAKLLVEKGADINFISPNGNSTALVWSMLFEKRDVAEYLLELGANIPEAGTPNCFINLQSAFKIGCLKYLEKYLSQGQNPLIEDESKNTLLHYAAEGNSLEIAEKLITLGVPVNKYNISGRTPLHIAAFSGNLSVVELLIKKGVDINERTIDGNTPYNLANKAQKSEVVNYLISAGADKSAPKFPVLEGKYLGQPKPDKTAVPFAPGIVAVNSLFHGSPTFSPDGNEAYWSIQEEYSLFTSKRLNGRWTMPDTASSIATGDVPFISPDGKKFYFIGQMEVEGNVREAICVRDKTSEGWSKPYFLPDIINSTPGIHWQVSVDRYGNLYYAARQNGGIESRIYYSEFMNGTYAQPSIVESLKDVNAASPFISSDGSYLIVSAEMDQEFLMILFKKKDGSWTQGKDITDIIGKTGICPIVTPDGKYLFFISDIPYWVDASFIKDLRKEALKDEN
jgi:ankyrin repeat protein